MTEDDEDEIEQLRAEDAARRRAESAYCGECRMRGGHRPGCPNEDRPETPDAD